MSDDDSKFSRAFEWVRLHTGTLFFIFIAIVLIIIWGNLYEFDKPRWWLGLLSGLCLLMALGWYFYKEDEKISQANAARWTSHILGDDD